ncbi:MAG: peroxiredoxin-like family protein [Planctomycetota bacterium]
MLRDLRVGERLPESLLRLPVDGQNLDGRTMGEQLRGRAVQLVFLRHAGCIFCRETVAELRQAHEEVRDYPHVLFVAQGNLEQNRKFFEKAGWPEAPVVADPGREVYRAFGVKKGTIRQLFGLSVWRAGRRARKKGHRLGAIQGNPWIMPGIFLIFDGVLAWRHRFQHAGDHPDFECVPGDELNPAAGGLSCLEG